VFELATVVGLLWMLFCGLVGIVFAGAVCARVLTWLLEWVKGGLK